MRVFTENAELKSYLSTIITPETSVGFVPTMGALHQGHLSLIRQSLEENEFTIVSIFVNPTQFNNAEDLKKYPRTLDADVEKIREVSDEVIIFAPTVTDIYGDRPVSAHFDFDGLEHQMEGKHRPGHFDGVGTIVRRLFEITKPTNAYFGEKDFQQLQIVRKMTEKQNLSVNIVGRPIFREGNGLAMSSRNERLSAQQKEDSAMIYRTLQQAKEMFGTKTAIEITDWVTQQFASRPDMRLEYFEIADEKTLQPAETIQEGATYRAFIAVYIGDIRLIDTISLN
jgi:pantoate--beta-alanine ligase